MSDEPLTWTLEMYKIRGLATDMKPDELWVLVFLLNDLTRNITELALRKTTEQNLRRIAANIGEALNEQKVGTYKR